MAGAAGIVKTDSLLAGLPRCRTRSAIDRRCRLARAWGLPARQPGVQIRNRPPQPVQPGFRQVPQQPPAGSCPSAGTESSTDSATVSATAVSQSGKSAPDSATGRPARGAMNPDSGSRPDPESDGNSGSATDSDSIESTSPRSKLTGISVGKGSCPEASAVRFRCRTETHGLVECAYFQSIRRVEFLPAASFRIGTSPATGGSASAIGPCSRCPADFGSVPAQR